MVAYAKPCGGFVLLLLWTMVACSRVRCLPSGDSGAPDTSTGTTSDTDITDTGTGVHTPVPIIVSFTGIAFVSPSSTPYGIAGFDPQTATNGYFGYDAAAVDQFADASEGKYPTAGYEFHMQVGTHSFDGSGHASLDVLLGSNDTIKFEDGAGFGDGTRRMRVDGLDYATGTVELDFVGPTDLLTNDALPTVFPYTDPSTETIAFSLKDNLGGLIAVSPTVAQ